MTSLSIIWRLPWTAVPMHCRAAGQTAQQHGILRNNQEGPMPDDMSRLLRAAVTRRSCARRRGDGGRPRRHVLPGCIWTREPGRRRADDDGHGVPHRLDDQGGHRRRRDAVRRARAAVARPAGRRDHAGARRPAGAGRVRRRRPADAATGAAQDHAAPSADAHRGLRLRCLEREPEPLRRGDRPADGRAPASSPR